MKQFGAFVFDFKQSRLLCKETKKEVEIEHKLFELLSLFVEQPNTIISRQDILDNLWAGSLVTDNAINKLIANLRKVLCDDAKDPRYIQTVPKRGYRLISEVVLLDNLAYQATEQHAVNETCSDKEYANSKIKAYVKNYLHYVIGSVLFAFFGVYFWQAFSDNDSVNHHYSVPLTRASGAEKSARMHPDNTHLYYLKYNDENSLNELWVKNIHTAIIKRAFIGKAGISEIIAVIDGEGDSTTLFYLDKTQDNCAVYQASLLFPRYESQATEKLFDCNDKRIKDIDYNAKLHTIYYAAQPKNFWPNQVYAFDLNTKKHGLITQVEPAGWGHHSIDVSPDGNKLLIMSTNSDYKTQVLSLNLVNNEITEGLKFNQPVSEAIWHHDSKQIYYYAQPPAQQIIKSDFYGDNAAVVMSVSEQLSSRMSRFPDDKNILFSTELKNYNNRWLLSPNKVNSVDNSTVSDSYPALFHRSEQYLFVSKRSGRSQLYLAGYNEKQAKIVTNFVQSHWLGNVIVSADDKSILLNVDNKIYQIPTSELNVIHPLTSLQNEHLVYTSQSPIISIDWLTPTSFAVTVVDNGNPELMVVSLTNQTAGQMNNRWAYGLSDSEQTDHIYFIEQHSNKLYGVSGFAADHDSLTQHHTFTDTQITLPKGFYHVKLDDNILYFVTTENDNEYLNAVSLRDNAQITKHVLNHFSSYDISNGKMILSDIESLEGDVHRTVL